MATEKTAAAAAQANPEDVGNVMKTMTTEKTAAAAAQANPEDVWNVMKTIYLPRGQENEEQSRFVAVNGRTFMVPKGKDVQVPLPVYEVLMNARMAEEEAFRRAQEDN